MRSLIIYSFLFLQFFCACNNEPDRSDTTTTSENDVDAARNFIRLALNGQYNEAEALVLPDSLNLGYLNIAERNYMQRMDLATRNAYRQASINIKEINPISDSVTIVHYTNSYKKQTDSIKVVKVNGQWLVDLKYTFSSNSTEAPQ